MSPYGITKPLWVKLGQFSFGHGLLPNTQQAITWTNAELLTTELLGTNFIETFIK